MKMIKDFTLEVLESLMKNKSNIFQTTEYCCF